MLSALVVARAARPQQDRKASGNPSRTVVPRAMKTVSRTYYEQTDRDNYKPLRRVPTGPVGRTARLVPELNRYFVAPSTVRRAPRFWSSREVH